MSRTTKAQACSRRAGRTTWQDWGTLLQKPTDSSGRGAAECDPLNSQIRTEGSSPTPPPHFASEAFFSRRRFGESLTWVGASGSWKSLEELLSC